MLRPMYITQTDLNALSSRIREGTLLRLSRYYFVHEHLCIVTSCELKSDAGIHYLNIRYIESVYGTCKFLWIMVGDSADRFTLIADSPNV